MSSSYGGLFIRSFADSLDFDLDVGIYSEGHAAKKPKSYDHEVFDVQFKDKGNGGIGYVSYARLRFHTICFRKISFSDRCVSLACMSTFA